jgi:hypothetical protein
VPLRVAVITCHITDQSIRTHLRRVLHRNPMHASTNTSTQSKDAYSKRERDGSSLCAGPTRHDRRHDVRAARRYQYSHHLCVFVGYDNPMSTNAYARKGIPSVILTSLSRHLHLHLSHFPRQSLCPLSRVPKSPAIPRGRSRNDKSEPDPSLTATRYVLPSGQ